MMPITLETVQKVAKLARLGLPAMDTPPGAAQVQKLQAELSSILSWINQLADVDTHNVEPLSNPSQNFVASTPVRPDTVTDGNKVQAIMSNAPEQAHNMFVVPKVVE